LLLLICCLLSVLLHALRRQVQDDPSSKSEFKGKRMPEQPSESLVARAFVESNPFRASAELGSGRIALSHAIQRNSAHADHEDMHATLALRRMRNEMLVLALDAAENREDFERAVMLVESDDKVRARALVDVVVGRHLCA
jgi:hypothetical protein